MAGRNTKSIFNVINKSKRIKCIYVIKSVVFEIYVREGICKVNK